MTTERNAQGVDVLAVLNRHLVLAEECASPEQVAEAHTVFNAVAELVDAAIAVLDAERNSYTACEVPVAALNRLDAAVARVQGGEA